MLGIKPTKSSRKENNTGISINLGKRSIYLHKWRERIVEAKIDPQQADCVVPIYCGFADAPKDEELSSIVQFANQVKFKSLTFIGCEVSSYLARIKDPFLAEEKARQDALAIAIQWKNHTKNALAKTPTTIPVQLALWNEYLNSESYRAAYAGLVAPSSKSAVEKLATNSAQKFLERNYYAKIIGRILQKTPLKTEQARLCLEYLGGEERVEKLARDCVIEEAAMTASWVPKNNPLIWLYKQNLYEITYHALLRFDKEKRLVHLQYKLEASAKLKSKISEEEKYMSHARKSVTEEDGGFTVAVTEGVARALFSKFDPKTAVFLISNFAVQYEKERQQQSAPTGNPMNGVKPHTPIGVVSSTPIDPQLISSAHAGLHTLGFVTARASSYQAPPSTTPTTAPTSSSSATTSSTSTTAPAPFNG
jgi:hypothetical protein